MSFADPHGGASLALSGAPRGGVSPLQQVKPREYEHSGADTGAGDPGQGREGGGSSAR
jgi:hypothetical protein